MRWVSMFSLGASIIDAHYTCCERTGVSKVILSNPYLSVSGMPSQTLFCV